ncbi:MAG: DUF6127 family protein [Pseudomonadota bacterium]
MSTQKDPPSATLTALARQALSEGADQVTLRAVIEEASELGARRALAGCGLHDESAGGDIQQLRQLLEVWRETSRTVRRAIITWIIRVVIIGLLIGLVFEFKLANWLPNS